MQKTKKSKVNVLDFGAIGNGCSDDTISIQRAIDSGSSLVIIPPGIYQITKTLKIPSHTTIRATQNTTIRLADSAGTGAGIFLLTNANHKSGNTNIVIEGGTWDGNNQHNPRSVGGDRERYGYSGVAITFIKVKKLELRNFTVKNPESYSVRLGEVEDFMIKNIILDQPILRPNQDGIHLGGFCQRGVIQNIKAVTNNTPNDDMIAINADDNVNTDITQGIKCGPIKDIQIKNLSAINAWNFVRLLSATSLIENITVENVSGGCRFFAVNMNNWAFPVGVGNIHNITLKNFNVSKSIVEKFCPALVKISLKVENLRICNFFRGKGTLSKALTLLVRNNAKNVLMFEGLDDEQLKNINKDSKNIECELNEFAKFTMDTSGEFVLRNGSIHNFVLKTKK